jgi:hypothetical protein
MSMDAFVAAIDASSSPPSSSSSAIDQSVVKLLFHPVDFVLCILRRHSTAWHDLEEQTQYALIAATPLNISSANKTALFDSEGSVLCVLNEHTINTWIVVIQQNHA